MVQYGGENIPTNHKDKEGQILVTKHLNNIEHCLIFIAPIFNINNKFLKFFTYLNAKSFKVFL